MPDHLMGSNAAESIEILQNSLCVKVHSSLCLELTKVLDKLVWILPAIESARPGCISGIQELCALSNTLEKAKLLIQHCTECSKLYLALTGESIVLRCERIRSSLNQSLQEVHNMVPEVLATQISDVLEYIRDARFIIDPAEEEAGKTMLELLEQTDSSEDLELKAFEIAAVSLNITSPKSFLAERRSIKKLLDKIHGSDSKKERILNYFLYLIKKYGKKVKTDVGGYKANFSSHEKCSIAPKSNNVEHIDQSTNHGETQTELSTADVPPEEFCCPISSRLMYDPVVIASGQTFERVSIEKWFSEGHDTCPKTKMKLTDLCMIPNSCMKDLIFNWSRTHAVKLEDPSTPFQCWEPSHCSSISSLKNVSAALLDGSSRDYMLQSDNSNVSFISSDTSYCSDSSYVKGINSLKDNSHSQFFSWSNDYLNCQSFSDFSHDMYLRFFYGLCELPLDLQAKAVEDLKFLLAGDDEICYAMLSNGFLESLLIFLRNAYSISDVHAQRTGAKIFLAFLNNLRVDIPSLGEDVYQLLTSFFNRFHHPEIILEALMILRKLSRQQNSNIVAVSGLPQSVLKLLDFEDHVVLESALGTLCDLSLHKELISHIISSECIPKVVTLLSDKRLAELCLKVLYNLSDIKEAAALIAETNGCISSIAEHLDCGSREEQTYGVAIFHSLCSYSLDYCLLILKEGVIPSLVHISVNGNAKGKDNAMKLLHIFRDLRLSGGFDTLEPPGEPSTIELEDRADHSSRKQANSKSSGFFGRKMRFFSKPRTLALS